MTPERWKSITDHYKMAKREGASLHYTMVGDCIEEIERLQECLRRIRDRQLGDPEEYWEMARKALEDKQ